MDNIILKLEKMEMICSKRTNKCANCPVFKKCYKYCKGNTPSEVMEILINLKELEYEKEF